MSDEDNLTHDKPFIVETAKQGRAFCKKCKQKCAQGDLRIAKLIPNPMGSGKIKTWHHVGCIFEVFLKQRQTTKRIEGPKDLEGWDLLSEDDKVDIKRRIEECSAAFKAKLHKSKKTKRVAGKGKPSLDYASNNEDSISVSSDSTGGYRDNRFHEFRSIVAEVSNVSSSKEKIAIFREIFAKGRDGGGFKGDIFLWCKLLLPAVVKRVFHLQNKQMVKIFSRIFHIKDETIMAQLNQCDVGQTIRYFFEQNKECDPAKKSTLTIHEVDEFLETLTKLSKEEDQYNHFKTFITRCTSNDLKVVIRLIKHDLRMNAGAKHVFEGLHPDAYQTFQTSRDIKTVINRCWGVPFKKEKLEDVKTKRSPKRKSVLFEGKPKKIKIEESKQQIKPDTIKDSVQEITERRQSIPNYFENVKLFLEDGVKDRHAEWVRYFIAYGGTVLNPDEHVEASHVLHLKDTVSEILGGYSSSARHVIVEWIKDTVQKESLQDYRPYTVRWKPLRKE